MQSHRVEELLSLLQPVWQQNNKLHLVPMLLKLAQEMGHQGALAELSDDQLIYHLKMRGADKEQMIPGLAKDCEADFKTALLNARGLSK